MAKRDIFIIPAAPARQQPTVGGARKAAAGRLRFGILDNSKGNADHLLRMLAESVQAQFPASSVVALRKSSAAAGADQHMLDQLAAEADFVVSAMAD